MIYNIKCNQSWSKQNSPKIPSVQNFFCWVYKETLTIIHLSITFLIKNQLFLPFLLYAKCKSRFSNVQEFSRAGYLPSHMWSGIADVKLSVPSQ